MLVQNPYQIHGDRSENRKSFLDVIQSSFASVMLLNGQQDQCSVQDEPLMSGTHTCTPQSSRAVPMRARRVQCVDRGSTRTATVTTTAVCANPVTTVETADVRPPPAAHDSVERLLSVLCNNI